MAQYGRVALRFIVNEIGLAKLYVKRYVKRYETGSSGIVQNAPRDIKESYLYKRTANVFLAVPLSGLN